MPVCWQNVLRAQSHFSKADTGPCAEDTEEATHARKRSKRFFKAGEKEQKQCTEKVFRLGTADPRADPSLRGKNREASGGIAKSNLQQACQVKRA